MDFEQSHSPYDSPKHTSSAPAPFSDVSRLGVASFAISLIAGLLLIGSIFAAVSLVGSSNTFDREVQTSLFVGLGVLTALALHLIGLIIGVIGLFQSNSKKIFTILGVLLNLVVLLGIAGILTSGPVGWAK